MLVHAARSTCEASFDDALIQTRVKDPTHKDKVHAHSATVVSSVSSHTRNENENKDDDAHEEINSSENQDEEKSENENENKSENEEKEKETKENARTHTHVANQRPRSVHVSRIDANQRQCRRRFLSRQHVTSSFESGDSRTVQAVIAAASDVDHNERPRSCGQRRRHVHALLTQQSTMAKYAHEARLATLEPFTREKTTTRQDIHTWAKDEIHILNGRVRARARYIYIS
jgi:hypothetical protein